jgi:hypothetical protein
MKLPLDLNATPRRPIFKSEHFSYIEKYLKVHVRMSLNKMGDM